MIALILFLFISGQHVKPAPANHKYYVTGYASLQSGGDCTHPALVSYGRDRVGALINAGVSPLLSGVTVWTESEYAEMRKSVGSDVDNGCQHVKPAKPYADPIHPLATYHAEPAKPVPTPVYCDAGGCVDSSPALLSGTLKGKIADPHVKPKAPKVDCFYYRCNDALIFDGYSYENSDDTASSITVRDGSSVVMLSYSEYSHLQSLRKAVVDEEKRLAVKYGACLGPVKFGSYTYCYGQPDHYSYHGQFLLIEKESNAPAK